jgi:hypothetical protein
MLKKSEVREIGSKIRHQNSERCFGMLSIDETSLNEQSRQIVKEINIELRKNTDNTIELPYSDRIAVSEFDENMKIFAMSFPWLFPGGVGDPNDWTDDKRIQFKTWMKKQLLYFDGRFAKDKMWCFYALNYFLRRKNHDQGAFYINRFNESCPTTLPDLKQCIRNGDTSFIDKILYFGNKIRGSPAYWRQKVIFIFTKTSDISTANFWNLNNLPFIISLERRSLFMDKLSFDNFKFSS